MKFVRDFVPYNRSMNYMDKNKLQVMWQVVDGYQSVYWAAAKLHKSPKTIRRYAARLRANQNDDLIHKNRGRIPVNKIDHKKIWQLYIDKYYGLNISFFCEKLLENEKIKVSEGLVRLIFKEHNEVSVQAYRRTRNEMKKRLLAMKKLDKHQKEVLVRLETEPYVQTNHPSQPRCKYFGEELQMDASIHLWFGNRKCALHTAIDDATGMIVGAYFDWQETRNGYYQVTRQFLTEYGVPVKIKTDKRTVFEYKKKANKDMAEDTMTQYQHVCQTLGVELECSSEPQFKPRVERSYRTLQGRLPFELKQAGVTTLEQANEFLNSYIKKFNKQFAICDGIPNCWAKQVTKDQIDMADFGSAKACIVAARSAAETPVVQPSNLSTVTVNGVPNIEVLFATWCIKSNSAQRFSVIGAHSTPRPCCSMKFTFSGVIFSAAMIKSPSFSRSSSSTTITNFPV